MMDGEHAPLGHYIVDAIVLVICLVLCCSGRDEGPPAACTEACSPYVAKTIDDNCYCLQGDGSYKPVPVEHTEEK